MDTRDAGGKSRVLGFDRLDLNGAGREYLQETGTSIFGIKEQLTSPRNWP
jgi:hypothetical protein